MPNITRGVNAQLPLTSLDPASCQRYSHRRFTSSSERCYSLRRNIDPPRVEEPRKQMQCSSEIAKKTPPQLFVVNSMRPRFKPTLILHRYRILESAQKCACVRGVIIRGVLELQYFLLFLLNQVSHIQAEFRTHLGCFTFLTVLRFFSWSYIMFHGISTNLWHVHIRKKL